MLSRISRTLAALGRLCKSCRACMKGSPLACTVVTLVVLLLLGTSLVFNIYLARAFGVAGAVFIDAGLFFMLLRLAVRVLVFPGSLVLWQRSTEANYRVEMAKQFSNHLGHLHKFLLQATARSPTPDPGAATDAVLLGCVVIQGLARNFRLQQRDQVRFTEEQLRMRILVQGVEEWLAEAKVLDRRAKGDAPSSLLDWLRRGQGMGPLSQTRALSDAALETKAAADAEVCVDRVERLLAMLGALQRPEPGIFGGAWRFLRAPTVGSLHQLRAELASRHNGRHCWVRAPGGRRIDAMLICSPGVEACFKVEEAPVGSAKELLPLKSAAEARAPMPPVIVWCNANAAYYETMAYEPHWLDFYLGEGFSVFVFNYSGFGRSEGVPTPAMLAADGCAVVEFLKARGFTQVGVHGRSIGGIAACSIAQSHPDVVRFLVADRTFSTLARTAKFTFGDWAVRGLSLSATWADNWSTYSRARCYKVILQDARDVTIPDLSSLRTAAAVDAVQQARRGERLELEPERADRLGEAWAFLQTLVSVCTSPSPTSEGRRPARQPVLGKPVGDADSADLEAGEEAQRLVSSRSGSSNRRLALTPRWLEENAGVCLAALGHHVDSLALALDLVGGQLNAAGGSLEEAFGRCPEEPRYALACFLANLQVWGSVGGQQGPPCPTAEDPDIERFLRASRSGRGTTLASGFYGGLHDLSKGMSPERVAEYHRRLASAHVDYAQRELRQHLLHVYRGLEVSSMRDEGVSVSAQLCAATLGHLREVEQFVCCIHKFLLGASSGAPNGSATTSSAAKPARPSIDRAATGHFVALECGHNGIPSEGELRQLSMHLRASRFGRDDNHKLAN